MRLPRWDAAVASLCGSVADRYGRLGRRDPGPQGGGYLRRVGLAERRVGIRPRAAVAWWTRTAPGAPAGKCLRIDVRFSGKGFEWFGVGPGRPLVGLPGDLKTVTLHYKLGDKHFPLMVEFQERLRGAAAGRRRSCDNGSRHQSAGPMGPGQLHRAGRLGCGQSPSAASRRTTGPPRARPVRRAYSVDDAGGVKTDVCGNVDPQSRSAHHVEA